MRTSLLLNWVLRFNGAGACHFWREAIGLLRRLRNSARIVETASVVDSEICTDGSGKQ